MTGREKSKRWKIGAALCLGLGIILAAALWWANRFPETLPLRVSRLPDFGDMATEEYDPALIPFLDDYMELQKQEVWSGCLGDYDDTAPPSAYISVVRANSVQEDLATPHDLYLLCGMVDAEGNLNWQIMALMGTHTFGRGFKAEQFDNVLGYDGWKISLLAGLSAGYRDYYVSTRPDGRPCLVAVGSNAKEADVDGDGRREIISCSSFDWSRPFTQWEILDKAEGEEAFLYTLNPYEDGFVNLGVHFDSGERDFVIKDSHDKVTARYALQEGAMARMP